MTSLDPQEFITTRQGFRLATSTGGVLTGRGADIILIDDPLKPDEALSETQRNAANEWYDHTLYSRLNDKRDGAIVIIMQRLHEDDLVGNFFSRAEQTLLAAIQRPAFNIAGLRRADLRPLLARCSPPTLTRHLARLRQLGVIKRVTGTSIISPALAAPRLRLVAASLNTPSFRLLLDKSAHKFQTLCS